MHESTSHDHLVGLLVVSHGDLSGFRVGRTAHHKDNQVLWTVTIVKSLKCRELLSDQLPLHGVLHSRQHGRFVSKQKVLNFIHLEETLELGARSLASEKLRGTLVLASIFEHVVNKVELLFVDTRGSHLLLQLEDQVVIFITNTEEKKQSELLRLRDISFFDEGSHIVVVVLLVGALRAGCQLLLYFTKIIE